jgi:amino acid transporter
MNHENKTDYIPILIVIVLFIIIILSILKLSAMMQKFIKTIRKKSETK